jgi:catechol 2,3-dioxygenase-like lactoylglutathione lyase family enzyme
MRIQGITIEVSDLAASKDFYENVLGLQPGEYYEPTKWQPYTSADQYFAIREVEAKKLHDDFDITNFGAGRRRGTVGQSEGLGGGRRAPRTDAVGHKFVVKDLDGYRLGFVRARKE